MTTYYGSTFTAAKSGTLPQRSPDGALVASKRRSTTEVITLASQIAGSLFYIGTLPIGAVYEDTVLTTDTSLGSTTVGVGTLASSVSLGAAAVLTATDTPTVKSKASAKAAAPLTAPVDVYLITAAATLPASGTLVSELRYKTRA